MRILILYNRWDCIRREQLIHFDGLTDTGRDLYITASKGSGKMAKRSICPLNVFTAGFGTGKMALKEI